MMDQEFWVLALVIAVGVVFAAVLGGIFGLLFLIQRRRRSPAGALALARTNFNRGHVNDENCHRHNRPGAGRRRAFRG